MRFDATSKKNSETSTTTTTTEESEAIGNQSQSLCILLFYWTHWYQTLGLVVIRHTKVSYVTIPTVSAASTAHRLYVC